MKSSPILKSARVTINSATPAWTRPMGRAQAAREMCIRDRPAADPDRVCHEIEDIIGIPALDAPRISAKAGINIEEVLERVVTDIPAPQGDDQAPLKALIFDSYYDSYKGVIVYVRVMEGTVRPGMTIRMMASGSEFTVVEAGAMGATNLIPLEELSAGQVGYITASIKTVQDTTVGDTVTDAANPAAEPLPGYRKVNPMVFCGIYPCLLYTSRCV